MVECPRCKGFLTLSRIRKRSFAPLAGISPMPYAQSVTKDLAKEITESTKAITIGIGAGPYCDGQVLVFYDLVGLVEEIKPKFVKRYVEGGQGKALL